MKLSTTQLEAVNSYAKFLQAGGTYGDAMRRLLGDTPCITLLEALAKVHAAHFKCNYTWNKHGHAVFHTGKESTRATRHMAAYQSWQRNVMVWFKEDKPAAPATRKARISKHTRDAAETFLAEFEGKDKAKRIAAAIAVLRAMR